MASRFFQQAVRGYASQAGAVKPPIALHGLAGKYASSTFVAAASKDAKTLEKVETDLKQVKSLLSGSSAEAKKVKEFIANPTLSTKAKTEGVNQLLGGKEGEITRNLFQVLAAHGRLSETERVVDGFLQLMSAHRGEVEVVITSATALDKSTAQRLESALKSSQYAAKGKSVKVTQKVDPSIQGGLIVDLGDRSVDLSVSSRVNRLNTLLQQGV